VAWRDELRASPRLRLGLLAIAATLALYGLLEWHDHQERRALELQRLQQQVQRLANRPAVDPWPGRLEEARAALESAEQLLWVNSSVGLAQAQFQDWLREQLRQANLQNPAIRVSEASAPARSSSGSPDPVGGAASASAAATADLLQVAAQVEFALPDPKALVALLAGMSDSQRPVIVESLVMKAQRVDMRVVVWFRIVPGARPSS
jgi:hypothetical protein